jgi:hypothetical protein
MGFPPDPPQQLSEGDSMTITRAEAYKQYREQKRAHERSLSVNGVFWYEAAVPRRWHRCYAHTSGIVSFKLVERCACGAIRYEGSRWMEKNARRKK